MFRPKTGLVVHALLVVLLSQHFPFFWDTVQLSAKQAYWFFEQGFGNLLLPDELDSGHPPLMGLYLAMCWSWLGKSLAVSHWAMLPAILIINFSLYFLIREWASSPRQSFLLMFLFWLDPVLAGQLVLVSPDVFLVAFFLMTLWGMRSGRRPWVTVGLSLLALISMRGMMTAAALALYEWWKGDHPRFWRAYLPGFGLALAFLGYHYYQKGWIGYHSASPWAPSFEGIADPKMFLRNALILLWRLLDFGRVFVWLGLAWLLYKRVTFSRKSLILPLAMAIVFFPVVLAYAHLSAHRYLLPLFLSLHLLLLSTMLLLQDTAFAKKVLWLIVIGLALGNVWVYPRNLAQGWDATLAHIPYYRLRSEMLDYIKSEGIPLDSIGTAFPEIGPVKYRDLSDSNAGMQEKNLSGQRYIYYTTVMNDFSSVELAQLEREWLPLKKLGSYPVQVVLYQKKE